VHSSEAGIRLLSRRIELGRCIHPVELGMVEGVVHFPAELKRLLLFDGEILEYRNIVIVESRKDEFGVVAVISDVAPAAGPLEYAGIKPAVDRSLAARQRSVPGLHHSARLAAARKVETVGGRERDIRR